MGLANLVAIIRQAEAGNYRDVSVPEWGGDVRLRRLDADDWLRFVDRLAEYETDEDGNFLRKSDMLNFGADLLCRSIINETGDLVMDNDTGRKTLKYAPMILARLMTEAMELSGLAGDVTDAVEGAKKN